MKKIIRFFTILFISFILFPLTISAATELTASTQHPIVGKDVYVQLDINYSKDLKIGDVHLVIKYDPTMLRLKKTSWIQSEGAYNHNADKGIIRIDKEYGRDWRPGASMMFTFIPLREGVTEVTVEAPKNLDGSRIESHFDNKNVIGQTFAPITLNPKNPNTSTELKSLGIKGYTVTPTFSRTHYEYSLRVPADVSSVNVEARSGSYGQRINGLGRKDLEYGENELDIKVISQSGAEKVYKITVFREDNRTEDTSLKMISIGDQEINITKENKNQASFKFIVSKSVESVILTARTNDPNALLNGTGKKTLKTGDNIFNLRVTSSKGTYKDYKININRSTEELNVENDSTKLIYLRVNNLLLDLHNETKKWYYGVGFNYNEVSIATKTESDNATVEIIGNKKLKEGTNKIIVKVYQNKGKDNETSEEYTIIIYKNQKDATYIKDINKYEAPKGSDVVYTVTSNDSHIINSNTVALLKNNKNRLFFNTVNTYNGLLYQVVLPTDISGEIDTSIDLIDEATNTYGISVPKGTEVTINLNDRVPDGNSLMVYSLNSENKYVLITAGVEVVNGYVTFTTNGDKEYILSATELVEVKGPFEQLISKYKKPLIISILFIIVIIVLSNLYTKYEKIKESKEPLY